MTTQDVNQILAIMKANYNYALKNMSQEEKYMLLCTWTVTLQDLPADIVMLAVMQLVSQSKWLPTVAEIREKCRDIHYAAAMPDTAFDMMVANGMPVTPEQQREHDRREAKRKYIAEATKHLCNEDHGALTLDSLLVNPAFEGIGTGRPSFMLQGGGRMENRLTGVESKIGKTDISPKMLDRGAVEDSLPNLNQ